MIKLTDINYSIGDRQLLKNINLIINPGQKSALLGVNGSGKTTLLRIITGETEAESGDILKPNNYKIGYLPQEISRLESGIILDEVKSGRPDILRVEKKLDILHKSFDEEVEEKNLKKLGEIETEFISMDGYELERKAKKILFGLGFTEKSIEKKISELSGGWQMRVFLAKLLLSEPDLLLLDEPTNHLDIRAIEWLEKFLGNFSGGLLVVTHDRFFIDRVTKNIYELSGKKLSFYNGEYKFFIERKKADEELSVKKMKEILKKKEHLERFINRFRYKATKARQVKSREKEYEKLGDVELISTPEFLKFDIKISKNSFRDVVESRDVYFKYENDWVLKNLNLKITKGERIALIGENGSGKSTLAKLISGIIKQQQGEVIIGKNTDIGFYAQHQGDVLEPEMTVFDSVASYVPETDRTIIRKVLGLFGFSGDDVNKKIGILSGGEKSRVSLSRILMIPNNFLIMDEPTNHLDSISRDALESALKNYEGTLLLISHDRYFLDKIVQRVIELKGGKLNDYDGNYTEYLKKKEDTVSANGSGENLSESSYDRRTERKLRALSRQEISSERGKLQSKIKDLEIRIGELEQKKHEMELILADPATYEASLLISKLQKEYSRINKNLTDSYTEWEKTERNLVKLMGKLSDN